MSTDRIAWLGTGIMGGPMARNCLDAGLAVTVWNRTAGKAQSLAAGGARIAGSPEEAATDASMLVTVLADGVAVDACVGDAVLDALAGGAVWVQMSTVGVRATQTLSAKAAAHGVTYVDAPVVGTRAPAEAGALHVLAACDPAVRGRLAALFDAVGARTTWVGEEPGAASSLKLVVNAWVLGLLGALAESIALAEALNVDPQAFLDTIDGGPVGAGYAQIKGAAMLTGEYPPSFTVALARKDAGLIRDAAADAKLPALLAERIAAQLARAEHLGHGGGDMAAIVEAWRAAR